MKAEADPNGFSAHTPGAKLDDGKVMAWLCVSGFSRALFAVADVTTKGAVKYTPNAKAKKVYDELYALYRLLHDGFGGVNRSVDLSRVMKDLIAIRERNTPVKK